MKKILFLLCLLVIGTSSFGQDLVIAGTTSIEVQSSFKNHKGIDEQSVIDIAQKIMTANKLPKRVPIFVDRKKYVDAHTNIYDKKVTVYEGLLFYFDNNDELAYVLSHEIAHATEAYGGVMKFVAMNYNPKKYEQKADLNGIDYMVQAGYDPIAAITMGNKIFGEPIWDWGFTYTHPKGSKRLIEMYKYIYVKYPQYLNSPLTKTPSFKNFEYMMSREINAFQQKQKRKLLKDEL